MAENNYHQVLMTPLSKIETEHQPYSWGFQSPTPTRLWILTHNIQCNWAQVCSLTFTYQNTPYDARQTGCATPNVYLLLLIFYSNYCSVLSLDNLEMCLESILHTCPFLAFHTHVPHSLLQYGSDIPSACCQLFCSLHHTGFSRKLLSCSLC